MHLSMLLWERGHCTSSPCPWRRNKILRTFKNRIGSALKHSVNLDQEKSYEARTSIDKPIATNKTTGNRNISWSEREQKFIVSIKRHGKYFKGRANTLDEAIRLKEQKVAEAEKLFQEKIYKTG